MSIRTKKEILIGAVAEMVQHLLPTQILSNLNTFDTNNEEIQPTANDLEDEKFIQELLLANRIPSTAASHCPDEKFDHNRSLTYYDIIEEEMISSLTVSKQNIQTLIKILGQHTDLNSVPPSDFNLQTMDQLVNLAIHSLMSGNDVQTIEQSFFLDPGVLARILIEFCKAVSQLKDKFIQWPGRGGIERHCHQFEQMTEFGNYDFYNVFGAMATKDFRIKPPLKNSFQVQTANESYTPLKLQCCCNANGLLFSSFIFFPKKESDTKNSRVFEASPSKVSLENMKSKEAYIVADQSMSLCPILMTPYDKIVVHSEQHNRALESKWKIIEKVFDRICSKFPILNHIELRTNQTISQLIETICILHNFFVMNHDEGYTTR